MSRKLLILALLLAASISEAATRTRAVGVGSGRPESGATAGGIVESVNGNLVTLAGGLVTVDVAGARIVIDRGREGTAAQIAPGMLLFAALQANDAAPNAPLAASMVTLTSVPDATLFASVQSVDVRNNTFTILGRTIRVTPDTSFGGFYDKGDGAIGTADLKAGQIVQAMVVARGGEFVATSVLIVAPVLPTIETTRGVVQSIGPDSWTIDRERGDNAVFLVNAQTRIAGDPKTGDTVEIVYTKNDANALVAISIIKYERPTPPPLPNIVHLKGRVRSIEGPTWVLTRESERITFTTNDRTRIQPGIVVGDNVDVLAEVKDDRSLVALVIVELR